MPTCAISRRVTQTRNGLLTGCVVSRFDHSEVGLRMVCGLKTRMLQRNRKPGKQEPQGDSHAGGEAVQMTIKVSGIEPEAMS